MKTILKLIPLIIVILFTSCSGNNGGGDPEPQTGFQEKLQGTWNLSSVTRNSDDTTTEFTGFTISFNTTNYSVTNGGTAWAEPSGSLTNFDAQNTGDTQQVYMGPQPVTLQFSNDNKTLTMTYTIDNSTFGGGRAQSLAGNYVFVVTK